MCFHDLVSSYKGTKSSNIRRRYDITCYEGRIVFTFRNAKIQVVLDREHEIAKQQLAAGNKDRAILALRKKKYHESLLAKTYAQLENLEHLVRWTGRSPSYPR